MERLSHPGVRVPVRSIRAGMAPECSAVAFLSATEPTKDSHVELTKAITWAAERNLGALITIRADGRPQSSDIVFAIEDSTFLISITDSRCSRFLSGVVGCSPA